MNQLDLVIINTQHNPTEISLLKKKNSFHKKPIQSFRGKQWSEDVVKYLMDLAMKYQSYLLIDDAYYCVNDPHIPIANTLKI